MQLFHVGSKLASSENSVSDLALKVARRKGNKEKETGGIREKKGGRETVAGNNTKTCEETVAERRWRERLKREVSFKQLSVLNWCTTYYLNTPLGGSFYPKWFTSSMSA